MTMLLDHLVDSMLYGIGEGNEAIVISLIIAHLVQMILHY